MTVRLYRHDDASAPVLTGQAGSLTTLLDAVLVNGYGSKTAAGWSINQTTTNKRGYKQGAGGNHPDGICLYVDDTGPGGAGAREARVCGFETMSAITPVGTGKFPTAAQATNVSGFLVIRKSTSNDAVARKWYIIANAWTVYIFIKTGDTNNQDGPVLGNSTIFGDFTSYKAGDAYAQVLIARTAENTTDGRYEAFSGVWRGDEGFTVQSNLAGHFFSRHWNQSTVSVRGGKFTPAVAMMAGATGAKAWNGNDNREYMDYQDSSFGMGYVGQRPYAFPYPNPTDGSLWMAPFWLFQNGVRGHLTGIYAPCHTYPLNPGDTFTVASGNLSGKSFIAVNGWTATNETRQRATQAFIEFSDTWS